MDKAPNPSGWGLLLIIGLFAFLIWYGPISKEPDMHESVQHGTIHCDQDPKTLSNIQLEICIDIQSFNKGSDYDR